MALRSDYCFAFKIARIGADGNVPSHIVERLREIPSAAVLSEIDRFALGALRFENIESKSIIVKAEDVLAGQYDFGGVVRTVEVPFKPTDDLFGRSTWHLRLSSLLVASLLVRAFEVSGDDKYLRPIDDIGWTLNYYLPSTDTG